MQPEIKELYDTYFSSLKSAVEEYCEKNHIYPWEVDIHPQLGENESLSIQLNYNGRQEPNE